MALLEFPQSLHPGPAPWSCFVLSSPGVLKNSCLKDRSSVERLRERLSSFCADHYRLGHFFASVTVTVYLVGPAVSTRLNISTHLHPVQPSGGQRLSSGPCVAPQLWTLKRYTLWGAAKVPGEAHSSAWTAKFP